jgi:hypothetical protein
VIEFTALDWTWSLAFLLLMVGGAFIFVDEVIVE